MTEWLKGNELQRRMDGGDLGGTMRLGAYPAALTRGSRVAGIYGTTEISERHRHRYEVNTGYKGRLEQHGMRFSGMSPDGILPEIIEYEDHPWFIGVQFHPELKSRPFEPHPLFASVHRRGGGAEPAGVEDLRESVIQPAHLVLRVAALGALQLGLILPFGEPLGLFGFLGRRIER